MERLDIYEKKPHGMELYLSSYGWHFSKKMCDFAISLMEDKNGNKITIIEKNELVEKLKTNNINVNNIAYDIVYVYAMAKADYFGSSLVNEIQLLKFLGDYFNDKDGYDTAPFTRFYADCIAKGIPLIWTDLL